MEEWKSCRVQELKSRSHLRLGASLCVFASLREEGILIGEICGPVLEWNNGTHGRHESRQVGGFLVGHDGYCTAGKVDRRMGDRKMKWEEASCVGREPV